MNNIESENNSVQANQQMNLDGHFDKPESQHINTDASMEFIVSELIKMREDLELEFSEKKDKIFEINQNTQDIEGEKVKLRNKKKQQTIELFKLELQHAGKTEKIHSWLKYVQFISSKLKDYESDIQEIIRVVDFENGVMSLKDRYVNSMVDYSEEHLQKEISERASEIRDKRVELTKLDDEIERIEKQIEENRIAAENAKKEELQKIALEAQKRHEAEQLEADMKTRIQQPFRSSVETNSETTDSPSTFSFSQILNIW